MSSAKAKRGYVRIGGLIAVFGLCAALTSVESVVGSWLFEQEPNEHSEHAAEFICLTLSPDGTFSIAARFPATESARNVGSRGAYKFDGDKLYLSWVGAEEPYPIKAEVVSEELTLTPVGEDERRPSIVLTRTLWCEGRPG